MRIRSLKPEWLEDEAMLSASDKARLLTVALILLADDHGMGRANEMVLAGRVFPMDGPKGPEKIRESLAELSRMGFLVLYEVRGQRYYAIRNWGKHQRVDKPGKPRVPPPEEGEIVGGSSPHEPPPANIRESSEKIPESFATDHDQDHDQEQPRACAREELLLRLWQLWDQGHLRHRASPAGNRAMWDRELAVIAGAVEQHAHHRGQHPSEVAEQLMARVWSDPWVQQNGQRARLGHVAKHVGHYLATESSGDAPADDLTKRVRELLAEQERLEGEVDPDSRQRLEQVRSELSEVNAQRRAQGGARAAATGGGS